MARIAPPPVHPRRLVFLGTPEMAVPPLRALHTAGFDIALVVTRADKRRGRGGAVLPSPVKVAALDLGLPVSTEVDDVCSVGAELGVVVAFGRIIRPHVLDAVPMVNLHFSLLPRWRGAAPVERALLAGDAETGVAVMAVEDTLDTGGIYDEVRVPIGPTTTAAELRATLTAAGATLLVGALEAGLAPPRPQVGEATYAEKIDPAELELHWDCPADVLDRLVRVGGAWTTFRGRRLKVWAARPVPAEAGEPGQLDGTTVRCGAGALELVEVQPEGKGRQPVAAWRNGARPAAGERLGP